MKKLVLLSLLFVGILGSNVSAMESAIPQALAPVANATASAVVSNVPSTFGRLWSGVSKVGSWAGSWGLRGLSFAARVLPYAQPVIDQVMLTVPPASTPGYRVRAFMSSSVATAELLALMALATSVGHDYSSSWKLINFTIGTTRLFGPIIARELFNRGIKKLLRKGNIIPAEPVVAPAEEPADDAPVEG